MKCIILLVIFAIAHEGVTGVPRHFNGPTDCQCEQVYELLKASSENRSNPTGRGVLSHNPVANYVKCKWIALEKTYQEFKHKFEEFLHSMTQGFLPKKKPAHNTTQINEAQTVSTPDKSTDNQELTPVKIDDKETKPKDKDPLTSQNTAASDETQENGTQTSPTLGESTVNQEPVPIEDNDKEKKLPEEEEEDYKEEVQERSNPLHIIPLHRIHGWSPILHWFPIRKDEVETPTKENSQTEESETLNKSIDNQQPTPVKIDDKEAKPEDSLTSQNTASSDEQQENGTQTSPTLGELLKPDDKKEVQEQKHIILEPLPPPPPRFLTRELIKAELMAELDRLRKKQLDGKI